MCQSPAPAACAMRRPSPVLSGLPAKYYRRRPKVLADEPLVVLEASSGEDDAAPGADPPDAPVGQGAVQTGDPAGVVPHQAAAPVVPRDPDAAGVPGRFG